MDTIVDYPYSLMNIELTNRCICRCIMCPRTYAMTRAQGDMDVNVFKMIIDQYVEDNQNAGNTYLWLHHFGESLLHPYFDECILYAHNKGLKPSLSVNPIMLTDDISDRLLNSNPYMLYVSLDGYDEKSLERLRGLSGKYEESKKKIFSFLNKKINSNNPVKVAIQTIKMRDNSRKIEDTELFWNKQAGVDMFHKKELIDWTGEIVEISELGDFPSTSPQCNQPFSTLSLAWDGEITPCCYDYNIKYSLGNIKDVPLKDAWNSKSMQRLRKEFIKRRITNELCVSCRNGGKLFNAMPRDYISEIKLFVENLLDKPFKRMTGKSILPFLRKLKRYLMAV